jgi:UDP-glucuronate 4-epimerase
MFPLAPTPVPDYPFVLRFFSGALDSMTILVTGCAGFIGFHACRALLAQGHRVIGVDNLNPYYSLGLKQARLDQLKQNPNFIFYPLDISQENAFDSIPKEQRESLTKILHLAAQPGVRYSSENPAAYIAANITGQFQVLELARHLPGVKRLVYASSSAVYGGNDKLPFAVGDPTDRPLSFYAATKCAGEAMAASYAHLYNLPITGLRFFTVYGPWGRPDMSVWKFTAAIDAGQPVPLYGDGAQRRDFTYIDDIIAGVLAALSAPDSPQGHRIYNLGNHRPEDVRRVIDLLSRFLGKPAHITPLPAICGDMQATYADITQSHQALAFTPTTGLEEGLERFVQWWRSGDYTHA